MSSAVNEELSRRRLIYLIISIIFSLNCLTNLFFTAWKNGDDNLPISMGLLDSWNMVSVGIALPFLLAFLMAYDCGCEVTKQFSKFLFVFFAGLALVSLIVNFLLNQLSPDRDLFLEIFGYKPGNVSIELSQEQKDEINTIMNSDNLATEVNLTMYKNNTNSVTGVVKTMGINNMEIVFNTKLFKQKPSSTETFFAINSKGEKIEIENIDIVTKESFSNISTDDVKDDATAFARGATKAANVFTGDLNSLTKPVNNPTISLNSSTKPVNNSTTSSSSSVTMVTLEKTFNQTPVTGNKIKIIEEEEYIKQENSIRIQTKKDLEASYQNVDAKYRRHPLNYSMRNVWLWLIFAISLFTHSIVVFSGFAYKKIADSSPNIDLDLL